jgi:hypothetical protein
VTFSFPTPRPLTTYTPVSDRANVARHIRYHIPPLADFTVAGNVG